MKTLTCVCLELDSMDDALFYYPVVHLNLFLLVPKYCFPIFLYFISFLLSIFQTYVSLTYQFYYRIYPVSYYNKQSQTTLFCFFFFLVMIESKSNVWQFI